MPKDVIIGECTEKEYVVSNAWSTPIRGTPELHVLSTPSLIEAVEFTCKGMIEEHLEEDGQSVGISVDIRHLAATPKGERFTVKARLADINSGRYHFVVDVFDRFEKIAEGKHDRFVVNLDRFRRRIMSKRTQ